MEYEVGKWYWFEGSSHSWIARSSGISDKTFFEYTEAYSNDVAYGEYDGIIRDTCWTEYCKGLATPEQIETCLKAYARKKGYLPMCKVRCIQSFSEVLIRGFEMKYDPELDVLSCQSEKYYSTMLYRNGKWAELIKEDPTKIFDDFERAEPKEDAHDWTKVGTSFTLNNPDSETAKLLFSIDNKGNFLIDGEKVSASDLIECYRKHGKK